MLLSILFQYMLYMVADLFHNWTNQHEEVAKKSYLLLGINSIVQNEKAWPFHAQRSLERATLQEKLLQDWNVPPHNSAKLRAGSQGRLNGQGLMCA